MGKWGLSTKISNFQLDTTNLDSQLDKIGILSTFSVIMDSFWWNYTEHVDFTYSWIPQYNKKNWKT